MERVYLDKTEFQDLMEKEFKNVTYCQVKDSKEVDPELTGLRTFEFMGILYVEKQDFKG